MLLIPENNNTSIRFFSLSLPLTPNEKGEEGETGRMLDPLKSLKIHVRRVIYCTLAGGAPLIDAMPKGTAMICKNYF